MIDDVATLPGAEAWARARKRLEELGPWDDRSALAGLGPIGLTQAWAGRVYAVQRYTLEARPGWDRLTVTRHDKRHNSPRWADWQALKLLLPDGVDRLGFEVSPPAGRTVDLAPAWHLWVLPLGDPLAEVLDLAPELGASRPVGPHELIRQAIRRRRTLGLAVRAIKAGPGLGPSSGELTLWGVPVHLDPRLAPGDWRLEPTA